MEFLKSLVPTVISGESGLPPVDVGSVGSREPGPRLLRMKRLISQTIEEEHDGPAQAARPVVRLQRHRFKGTLVPGKVGTVLQSSALTAADSMLRFS
ncbi:hypothetical protein DNTS_035695 [Danionella cerebrum]|uniref:Uncharacterized protein n=1 Tax=Danionella cerebrum TaxID=2873325 RepID=A0A553RF11_9TELE|nr:hypothetical protein DNTS_035695 [Danionella translucida]